MNDVIYTILNHRSIRHFEDKPLSNEQIKSIVSCAQAASTSSFIQAYSIIGIKDVEKRKSLLSLQEIKSMSSKMVTFSFFVLTFTGIVLSERIKVKILVNQLKVQKNLWSL